MLFFERLLLEFLRDLRTLRARFRRFKHIVQFAPLFLRVKGRHAGRRVIRTHALAHPSIALPVNVASGKMQQSAVIRSANEFDQVKCGIHIHGDRIAQIGIEIRQPRTVDDQVEFPPEPRRHLGLQAHRGLRYIALHHLNLFRQQRR